MKKIRLFFETNFNLSPYGRPVSVKELISCLFDRLWRACPIGVSQFVALGIVRAISVALSGEVVIAAVVEMLTGILAGSAVVITIPIAILGA